MEGGASGHCGREGHTCRRVPPSGRDDWPSKYHVADLLGAVLVVVTCAAMIVIARSRLSVDWRMGLAVGFFFFLAFAINLGDACPLQFL